MFYLSWPISSKSLLRKGCLLLVIAGVLLPVTRGQTNTASGQQARSISLQECIDLAMARSLGVQVARLGPTVALYELKSYYGAYDPSLTLQATRNYVDQPSTFDPKKLTSNRAGSDQEYEETVDQIGPSLGGKLPFGLHYDFYARSESIEAFTFASQILTNNYYGIAGMTFRQPLLKDFWIDADRRNLKLARSNLKISEWQLRDQLISAVTQVKLEYYNLILAREGIQVDRFQLERAERLASDVHKRVEAHGISPLEEPRVQSQVELARTALFGSEQNYRTQMAALWRLISDDYTNQVSIALEPVDALVFVQETETRSDWRQAALANRPEIWEMRLRLEKQDVALRYDSNQRLPDLSFHAGYGRQSIQPTFGETVDEVGSGTHELYSIGASLSFPIGNVTARNRYKADRAAKEQLQLSLRKAEQDALFEVDMAANALESTSNQIGSSRRAREFAELALEAENKLFQAGKSTPFLVLERQTALAQARLVELRALANYNTARAQLEKAQGVTLQKSGVNVSVK